MIETERLLLRPYRIEDYERIHLYGSLPDFSQYDIWGPNKEEDTRKLITDSIANFKKNNDIEELKKYFKDKKGNPTKTYGDIIELFNNYQIKKKQSSYYPT